MDQGFLGFYPSFCVAVVEKITKWFQIWNWKVILSNFTVWDTTSTYISDIWNKTRKFCKKNPDFTHYCPERITSVDVSFYFLFIFKKNQSILERHPLKNKTQLKFLPICAFKKCRIRKYIHLEVAIFEL